MEDGTMDAAMKDPLMLATANGDEFEDGPGISCMFNPGEVASDTAPAVQITTLVLVLVDRPATVF
jgi:hypothetical protein